MAAVPTTEITDSTTGIALTIPWPMLPTAPFERWARYRPMSSIFTMRATTP
jgi:hypothetical protein